MSKTIGFATTRYIVEAVRLAKAKLAEPNVRKAIIAELDELEIVELQEVEGNSSVCTIGNIEHSEKSLELLQTNPDPVILKDFLTERLSDYNTLKAIGCVVSATFIGIATADGNVARSLALKDSITNLHRIGSSSAFGYAMTGDYKNESDLYVIKSPAGKDAVEDSLHELFIGLRVMNDARKYIPNFVFTFGGIRYGAPVIDDNTKAIVGWSEGVNSKVPIVIYEPITPSVSLEDYAQECSLTEFKGLFRQALRATEFAANKYGWTHYDLHPGNLLVREVDIGDIGDTFQIPYPTPSGATEYVTASNILTFIDYGQSTADYKGVAHPMRAVSFRAFGVRNGPHPLHDVYKLVCFLGSYIRKNTKVKATYEFLRHCFTFFNNQESFESALDAQSPSAGLYYILPATAEILAFTVSDFIAYLDASDEFSAVISDKPTLNLLACTDCYTFAGTLIKSGLYSNDLLTGVHTLEAFYDRAVWLMKNKLTEQYQTLVDNFDYSAAKERYSARIAKDLATINKYLKTPMLDIPQRVEDIATRSAHTSIVNNHLALFSIVSSYEDVEALSKVARQVATIFQDRPFIEKIEATLKDISLHSSKIKKMVDNGEAVYAGIYKITKMSGWKFYEDKYPWYYGSASNIVGLADRFHRDEEDLFKPLPLAAALVPVAAPVEVAPRSPRRAAPAQPPVQQANDDLYPANSALVYQRDKQGKIVGVTTAY